MSDDAVEAAHGVRCGREMAHVSCALIVGHDGMHQYLIGGDDHWQIIRTIAGEAERRGRLAAFRHFMCARCARRCADDVDVVFGGGMPICRACGESRLAEAEREGSLTEKDAVPLDRYDADAHQYE